MRRLSLANFTNANLYGTNLTGVTHTATIFTGTKLDLRLARWPSDAEPPPGWEPDADPAFLKKITPDSDDSAGH